MIKDVVKELNLKWYERIVVKMMPNFINKIYKEGARKGFNLAN